MPLPTAPGAAEGLGEAAEGALVDVEDGDVMSGLVEHAGDAGTDAAAAHD